MNTKQAEKLSDFVRGILNERGLSYRDVSRSAKNKGYKISHSAVSDIINQRYSQPDTPTLVALARGLNVTEEEIFSIVRGTEADVEKIADERFAKIAEAYAQMPSDERDKLELVISVIEKAVFDWKEKDANRISQVNNKKPKENINYKGSKIPVLTESKQKEK